MKKHRADVALYAKVKQEVHAAKVPEHIRDRADARAQSLGGVPDWCRPAAAPFSRQSSCKSHDWKQLLQWSAGYVLHGVVPAQMEEAFFGMVNVLSKILEATSNMQPGEEDSRDTALEALKMETVRAMIAMEATVPMTDSAPIVFHIIPHVIDGIYRWNSVRNFWAFFTER